MQSLHAASVGENTVTLQSCLPWAWGRDRGCIFSIAKRATPRQLAVHGLDGRGGDEVYRTEKKQGQI